MRNVSTDLAHSNVSAKEASTGITSQDYASSSVQEDTRDSFTTSVEVMIKMCLKVVCRNTWCHIFDDDTLYFYLFIFQCVVFPCLSLSWHGW